MLWWGDDSWSAILGIRRAKAAEEDDPIGTMDRNVEGMYLSIARILVLHICQIQASTVRSQIGDKWLTCR